MAAPAIDTALFVGAITATDRLAKALARYVAVGRRGPVTTGLVGGRRGSCVGQNSGPTRTRRLVGLRDSALLETSYSLRLFSAPRSGTEGRSSVDGYD